MIISKCDMALSLYRHLYFVVKYSSKTVEDGSIIENSSKEASTLDIFKVEKSSTA